MAVCSAVDGALAAQVPYIFDTWRPFASPEAVSGYMRSSSSTASSQSGGYADPTTTTTPLDFLSVRTAQDISAFLNDLPNPNPIARMSEADSNAARRLDNARQEFATEFCAGTRPRRLCKNERDFDSDVAAFVLPGLAILGEGMGDCGVETRRQHQVGNTHRDDATADPATTAARRHDDEPQAVVDAVVGLAAPGQGISRVLLTIEYNTTNNVLIGFRKREVPGATGAPPRNQEEMDSQIEEVHQQLRMRDYTEISDSNVAQVRRAFQASMRLLARLRWRATGSFASSTGPSFCSGTSRRTAVP